MSAIFEFPDGPAVPLPDPIVGPTSEDRPAVGREANAALPWFELERELPSGDEELLFEVVAV
jgi:hypothetical protein